MPTQVSASIGRFDRFAAWVAEGTSRAWFFAACVATVILWRPSYFAVGKVNTWQLVINTFTTIVTFLLVALLQNTQRRADESVQHKLNAIADALADLLEELAPERPGLSHDRDELVAAVGLENRESA